MRVYGVGAAGSYAAKIHGSILRLSQIYRQYTTAILLAPRGWQKKTQETMYKQ